MISDSSIINGRDALPENGRGYCHHPLGFTKGITIASLNVNGLRGYFDDLQLFLENSGIHILALNETKLDPQYPQGTHCHSGLPAGAP